MLDPWIIAEIRRREEDRLREAESAVDRPHAEDPRGPRHSDDGGEGSRGVTVVDYTV